jgi:cytochrome P450
MSTTNATRTWPISVDDPYPEYQRMRDQSSVHWLAGAGVYLVVSHATAAAVIHGDGWSSDPRRSPELSARMAAVGGGGAAFGGSLLFSDPPRHTELRNAVGGYLTPRNVEQIRTRIGAIVDAALSCHEPDEDWDIMSELAYPVPLAVMCELMDTEPEVASVLRAATPLLAATLDPLAAPEVWEAAAVAGLDLMLELVPLVASRTVAPGDDLLSALVVGPHGEPGLPPDEAVAIALLLLAAGHETTANLIGNAVVAMHARPYLCRALRADPTLIPGAVEELLRFDSPVQLAGRIALSDCTLDGVDVAAGAQVLVGLGAANRDPDVFADPDVVRIGRSGPSHLGFGHGRHFCVGAALARIETQEVLRRLLELRPALEDWTIDIERGQSSTFRRVDRLTVRPG